MRSLAIKVKAISKTMANAAVANRTTASVRLRGGGGEGATLPYCETMALGFDQIVKRSNGVEDSDGVGN